MHTNFSILVNTTDSFEDCWYPFFKLFKKFWPDYKGKIYLNTEIKDYQYSDINVIPIKNQLIGKTWSQCLKYALNFIDEEIILYLQEDYFFNDFIKKEIIEYYINLMTENNIDCIHLTPFASSGPFEESEYSNLIKFSKKASYKISTQASLWRKSLMLKYLRDHEDAWHFEFYGTKRAWRYNEEIYMHYFKNDEKAIIPYVPTGIVRGKWNKEAVFYLFLQNEINIDFNKRGFYVKVESKLKRSISIKKIINTIKSFI